MDLAGVVTGPSPMKRDRSSTVSTTEPSKFKDLRLSETKKQQFDGLNLAVLLEEYRDIHDSNEIASIELEDEAAPSNSSVGEAEIMWLGKLGLEKLSEKIQKGDLVTREEILEETADFTPAQIDSVFSRVTTLNMSMKLKSKKPSLVHDLFKNIPAASLPTTSPPIALDSDPGLYPTNFYDLCESDQKNVQRLNLAELTCLLDKYNKSSLLSSEKKKKKKKKADDKGFFACDLESLVERDRKKFAAKMVSPTIPLFLSKALIFLASPKFGGLQEEGLFRVTGATARIKALRQTCEDLKGDVDFVKLEARPHDVSALVKQFLRDTPEPLLTLEYLEVFAVTQEFEPNEQLYALKLLITLLPAVNRDCLKYLLEFLVIVASHSAVNKMGILNLAVVFAPTLFYVRGHKGDQMIKEVELQVSTASVLQTLLEKNSEIWDVNPGIMHQMRLSNARKQGKESAASLLQKKTVKNSQKTVNRSYY